MAVTDGGGKKNLFWTGGTQKNKSSSGTRAAAKKPLERGKKGERSDNRRPKHRAGPGEGSAGGIGACTRGGGVPHGRFESIEKKRGSEGATLKKGGGRKKSTEIGTKYPAEEGVKELEKGKRSAAFFGPRRSPPVGGGRDRGKKKRRALEKSLYPQIMKTSLKKGGKEERAAPRSRGGGSLRTLSLGVLPGRGGSRIARGSTTCQKMGNE